MTSSTFLLVALSMGLVSSLHCVGMCLPLQSALGRWLGLGRWGWGLYHSGRLTAYAGLGAAVSLGGVQLARLLDQQVWLLGVAAAVLVLSLLPHRLGAARLTAWAERPLGHLLTRMQGRKRPAVRVVALGVLNGLLPCGGVLAALVGALAVPGPGWAAAYMAAFGLGTLPALVLAKGLLGRLPRFRYSAQVVGLVALGLLAYRLTVTQAPAGTVNCASPASAVSQR